MTAPSDVILFKIYDCVIKCITVWAARLWNEGTHQRASTKAFTTNVRLGISQTPAIVELNRHHGYCTLSSCPLQHWVTWFWLTQKRLNQQIIDNTEPKIVLKKSDFTLWEVFTSFSRHTVLHTSPSSSVTRLKFNASSYLLSQSARPVSYPLLSTPPRTWHSFLCSSVPCEPLPLPHIPGTLRAAPIWSALSLPSPAAMAVVIERWVSETKAQRLGFLNARSLAWNVVQGLVGNQAGRRRGRGGGGCIRPPHSLVRFVDPLHWLPQRPLPTPLCGDVSTGHVCSLAVIKVWSYFHKLTSDPAAFRATTGRKKSRIICLPETSEKLWVPSNVVLYLNSSK